MAKGSKSKSNPKGSSMRKVGSDLRRLRSDVKDIEIRKEARLASDKAKERLSAEVRKAQDKLIRAQKQMEHYIAENPKKSAAIAAAVGAAIGAGLTAAVMRRRRRERMRKEF